MFDVSGYSSLLCHFVALFGFTLNLFWVLVAGIDDPYEPPTNPEITMEVCEGGDLIPPEIMAKEVIQYLEERGFLQA